LFELLKRCHEYFYWIPFMEWFWFQKFITSHNPRIIIIKVYPTYAHTYIVLINRTFQMGISCLTHFHEDSLARESWFMIKVFATKYTHKYAYILILLLSHSRMRVCPRSGN
jgi:hypothetical protein